MTPSGSHRLGSLNVASSYEELQCRVGKLGAKFETGLNPKSAPRHTSHLLPILAIQLMLSCFGKINKTAFL